MRWTVLVLLAAAVACGGASDTAVSGAAPSPASSETPRCPYPQRGGTCLGGLDAGTYATRTYVPRIRYTVPKGWVNAEDLPTLFLLVPPDGTVEGVDSDTSDFIGIYRGVAAANPDCTAGRQAGVAQTSAALAAWLTSHRGLITTPARPVTVGGLSGQVVDVHLDPTYRGSCPFVEGGTPVVPLLFGIESAGVEHGINGTYRVRLYLLDSAGPNTVVEVVDHNPAAEENTGDLDDYARIVDSLRFG